VSYGWQATRRLSTVAPRAKVDPIAESASLPPVSGSQRLRRSPAAGQSHADFSLAELGCCLAPPHCMGIPKCIVYVLISKTTPARYYTGLTSNIAARLDAHNAGRCPHTADGKPWIVEVIIEFSEERRPRGKRAPGLSNPTHDVVFNPATAFAETRTCAGEPPSFARLTPEGASDGKPSCFAASHLSELRMASQPSTAW
jgi:hypothetical protein